MRPVVNRLRSEYAGRIEVVSLNRNGGRGHRIAGKYAASFTPTFVFVRPDGALQDVILGETDAEQLREKLELLLHPPAKN